MASRIEQARSLEERGEVRAAAELVRQFTDEERLSPEGLVLLARVSEDLGRMIAARAALLRAAKHPAWRGESLFGLARAAFVTERNLQADRYVREVLAATAGGPEGVALRFRALCMRAVVRSEVRRFPTAWRALEEAEALGVPDERTLLFTRTYVLRMEDRRDEVDRLLTDAEERFAQDVRVHRARADLRGLEGDIEGAVDAARRAVECAPECFRTRVFLAELAFSIEDWDTAGTHYDAAIQISPDADHAVRVTVRLGETRERLGDREGALLLFRSAATQKHDPIAGWAEELAKRVESAPADAARVMVPGFGRFVQKHNTCGPGALAVVIGRWGGDAARDHDHDTLTQAICESSGTTPYRLPAHARALGFEVRCFRGNPEAVIDLIRDGVPVILEISNLDSGHYTVAVGYDEVHRTLLFRDPASPVLRESDPRAIDYIWKQVGYRSIAIVPAEKAALLAGRELAGCEAIEVFFDAQKRLLEGDFDGAVERVAPLAWNEILEATGAVLLADVHASRGASEEEIVVLEEASRRFPDAGLVASRLAAALARAGRFGEAVEVCDRILAIVPHYGHVLYLRGRARLELGDPERARRDLLRSIRIDPRCAYRHTCLGEIHERLGDPGSALESYDISLELEPLNPWVHAERGEILTAMPDRLADAEASFRKAIEVLPEYPWAVAHLARLLHEKLGRIDEAEALYRKAIEMDPGQIWNWMQLGFLLRDAREDRFGARDCFERARALLPEHPWPWAELAELALDHSGDYREAQDCLRRFLEIVPGDPWAMSKLGIVYLRVGRLRKGVALLEKLLEIDPNALEIRFNLGLAYDVMKKHTKALETWVAFVERLEQAAIDAPEEMTYARQRIGILKRMAKKKRWWW